MEECRQLMPLDAIRQQHIQQMEQPRLLRNSGGMILKKEDGHSTLKKEFYGHQITDERWLIRHTIYVHQEHIQPLPNIIIQIMLVYAIKSIYHKTVMVFASNQYY